VKPLRPHPTDAGNLRGRNIEHRLLSRLQASKEAGRIGMYLQADAVVLDADGDVFFVEAKGQSAFTAPPFDGHGLPVAQALRYKLIHAAKGIRTKLIVWDDDAVWWQWLDVLEDGEHFDTKGTIKTPRRIYPLTNFFRVDGWADEGAA
jgi:hypothetical protein